MVGITDANFAKHGREPRPHFLLVAPGEDAARMVVVGKLCGQVEERITDLSVLFKGLIDPSFYRRIPMRAIEAETFSGYGGLRQIELPKPQPAKDRVLVRVTAAGVTPLDHTILSGGYPRAKAPLVLGNEGAGVIEDAGDSGLAVGSRVMFTGPYGVRENGAWQEWLLARPEDLAVAPDAIDGVVAASLPVAYLTAQITLTLAGFKPGMTVLAPAIGGSVGNATYQLARAQSAGRVISTAGSAAKAARARELGFEDVIDLTTEGLADGVRRIMAGKGVDIVIESIGGTVTSEALSSLGLGGVLITLGYSAGRKTTIDVTDLIWKGARMAGFNLFAQSPTAIATAWRDIIPLIVGGAVKPIVERVYPVGEAGEALRHLTEDRPFGKVVLTG
jgi:NADPH:quinone reductase